MFATLRKAFSVPDIRKKMLFTLGMLVIFRIGMNIPIPGTTYHTLESPEVSGIFQYLSLITGGAYNKPVLFSLGIGPYITASIIMQLLTVAIPALERLQKEGEAGRKKITKITRFVALIIATLQGLGLYLTGFKAYTVDKPGMMGVVVLSLVASTMILMYLGEKINDKGIGNGISLFIFAGIVSRLPLGIIAYVTATLDGTLKIYKLIIILIVFVVVTLGVIYVNEGKRKVPVQYAKKVVGRKMYGGQSTHIPLKVNQAGVIPVIFASVFLSIPSIITQIFPKHGFSIFMSKWFSASPVVDGELFIPGAVIFNLVLALSILGFTYFYSAITFNPIEIAKNLKENAGFVPGIRPGKPTSDFLARIVHNLNFAGAIFLASIALAPSILGILLNMGQIGFISTSLLIAVGVAIETTKQLEQQLVYRNYQGFIK